MNGVLVSVLIVSFYARVLISANNYYIRFSAIMITILIILNEHCCALNCLNETLSNKPLSVTTAMNAFLLQYIVNYHL